MKRSLVFALMAVLAAAGCSKSGPSSAVGTASSPREIDISANDTMKYDITAMQARPGEYLTVVLTNAGNVPKEVMAHNWILLKQGTDPNAFTQAAATAKDTDYIPASKQDEILAKISLLGPHQSGQVTFQAPTVPGDYTFLCSFPAHFLAGMHGVLTVK